MRWPLRWPFHDAAGQGATVARDTGMPGAGTPGAGTPGVDPTGGGPTDASPTAASPVAGPGAARRDWASLPPLQRSFDAPPLTAKSSAFARAVAADAALPLALAPLGHAREADAPGGLVRGLATAIADRTTVGIGAGQAGPSPSMPAPVAGAAAVPGGQHGQHAAGVPGRHVQRVMAAPSGGRLGESANVDDVTDGVGIGGAVSVGTPAGPLSDPQRAMSSTTASVSGESGVGPASSMAIAPDDHASGRAADGDLPPVQRLHDLPVRSSAVASSQTERHASLISADVTLPASPVGLVRRSAADSTVSSALPARGDHDEPGRGSTDLQRSVSSASGPASGSLPAAERPVRLSVGQVRRLGLGTPFTQQRPSAAPGIPGGTGTSPTDPAGPGTPSIVTSIDRGSGGPAGPGATDAGGPTLARQAAMSTADSEPGTARDSLAPSSVGTGRMPLAETRGHGRPDTSDAEASGAPRESSAGHDGDDDQADDQADGGDAGGQATVSRGPAGDPASAAGTGLPAAAAGTSSLGARGADHPTVSLESLAATPSRPRLGLGAPASSPAVRGMRGRDRANASAGDETTSVQRSAIDPGTQAVPLAARLRLPGTATDSRRQRTHDADVAFPMHALGEGVAQPPAQLPAAPARHAVVSRSVPGAPGSPMGATPGRSYGPRATPHAQTPLGSPRAGMTGDEPLPLVRAIHAAAMGGSETGDGAISGSHQPTVARSSLGDTSAPDLAGASSIGATIPGAFAAGDSGRAPSVQREDGSDAAVAAAATGATAGGGAAAGGSERELDELARRLYDRIRSRLRTELLVDRERAGALSDLL